MPTQGTVRIFLSPKFDESGNEWQFKQQRLFMIEMDRFVVHCKYYANKQQQQQQTKNTARFNFARWKFHLISIITIYI